MSLSQNARWLIHYLDSRAAASLSAEPVGGLLAGPAAELLSPRRRHGVTSSAGRHSLHGSSLAAAGAPFRSVHLKPAAG